MKKPLLEGGNAAQKLIQTKLSRHPKNKDLDLSLAKINDSDLGSIFPKQYDAFPGSGDSSVLGVILRALAGKGLISTDYTPKYMLGSTRLAAYKMYGPNTVPLRKSETPEIIDQASKKKTSYGDLDIDLQFSGDKKAMAAAIEEIDPSSFAVQVSAELHLAVKLDDNRVIQIDLIDYSDRGEEFALTQTSSFVDLAQNIKGVFHIMLMWAATHSMRVGTDDKIEAVMSLAASNPELDFAVELAKRQKNGWVPVKTKFSIRPVGLVLSIMMKKETPKGESFVSVPVDLSVKANYSDYDAFAKMMLQDDRATKEDIFHTLSIAKFIKQNKDKSMVREVWNDFIQMVETRIKDKISPEDYSIGVGAVKSALVGEALNERVGNRTLLLEGGLGGHLMNLYEDSTISFRKILEILTQAAKGKIVGTEKTDGFNVFLSMKDGIPRAARNKGDVKEGGMTPEDLAAREFRGGETIRKVYLAAFDAYEAAVKALPPKVQQTLFEDGRIWYNAEIQGPNEFTTINYDRNAITIHPRQHLKYDEETKDFETFTDPVLYKVLDKQIDTMEQALSGKNFKIQTAAYMDLKDLSDGKDLKIVKSQIEKELSKTGLSLKNNVGDYLYARIYPVVNKQMKEISDEIKEKVTNNLIGRAKLTGPEGLPKGLPQELKKKISALKKGNKDILKDAIFPIESAVHDYSVQLLSGLESVYIMNNSKEIMRLRKELHSAIKGIKSSGDKNAIDTLVRHMVKIKNIENVDTAIEGFVFDYNGQSYKFTGNFTPINHILALFRKVKSKKQEESLSIDAIEEDEGSPIKDADERIAIFPGAFKPPHVGHFQAAMELANKSKASKVLVFISHKPRAAHSAESRISITAEMSKKIWELYTKSDPRFSINISKFPTPTVAAYNHMETSGPGFHYFLGVGAKENDTRFKDPQIWADKKELGVKIDTIELPSMISGTEVREMIVNDDKGGFFSALPGHLTSEEAEAVWETVNSDDNKLMFEDIKTLVTRTLTEDFQDKMDAKYPKEKKRLIGLGDQGNAPPFTDDPSFDRANSGPPGGIREGEKWKFNKVGIPKEDVELLNDLQTVIEESAGWQNDIQEVLDAIEESEAGLRGVDPDYEHLWDKIDDIKMEFSTTIQAIKIDGPETFVLWMESLQDWLAGSNDQSAHNLASYREYANLFFGKPKMPKYLFRGMMGLMKVPEPEQAIVYSPAKQSATSWTDTAYLAQEFCHERGGDIPTDNDFGDADSVVLALAGDVAAKYTTPFLWPTNRKDNIDELEKLWRINIELLKDEREWGLWLKKPVPIAGVRYCQEDNLPTGAKKRIKQRKVKGITEEEDMKPFIMTDKGGENPMTKKLNEKRPVERKKDPPWAGLKQRTGSKGELVVPPNKLPKKQGPIAEVSSMAGGSVEGVASAGNKQKTMIRETEQTDRHVFYEELQLRKTIRTIAEATIRNRRNTKMLQEQKLRETIRTLYKRTLNEAVIDDATPHQSTGINVLEELLSKIIPTLETAYKTLTTSEDQRKSFRAHIVHGIITSIKPDESRENAGQAAAGASEEIGLEEQGVDVEVGSTEPTGANTPEIEGADMDNSTTDSRAGFIDIDKKNSKDVRTDKLSIAGEDATGRNMALQTLDKVENQILDAYSILEDEEDEQIFVDYLITNVKMYFDKFEKELKPSLEEPSSETYEKEKEETDDDLAGDDSLTGDEEI